MSHSEHLVDEPLISDKQIMQVGSSVNKIALNLVVDTFSQVSKNFHVNQKNKDNR